MAIDEKKFLELYDAHVGKIYRYIYFRVSAEETAQDLTSEVFLKSWKYLTDKEMKNPRAFFYQVARNLVADFYRQKDKAPISLDEIAETPVADKKERPDEQTARDLEVATVKSALGRLNDEYKEVIIWRYLDELEIKEIAEILDKSEGAVRTLLSRSLESLRKVLE